MSVERDDPNDVGAEAAADKSVVLDLDALGEFDAVEADPAQVAEAGRKLAETINRFTRPVWLEQTQRLSKVVEGAVSPQFLESSRTLNKVLEGVGRPQILETTDRIRDIVVGPCSPAGNVLKSISESVALRNDFIKPRSAIADALARSTADRAAFSLTSGLKVSDSVTSMMDKLVADTKGVGLGSSALSDSVARLGLTVKGPTVASLGLTVSDSVRRIADGMFAGNVGVARALATQQLVATSGIADLLAGDKMMASWRQTLLAEATARSLVGTVRLPVGNPELLRDIVGVNTAIARVLGQYADQNRSRMLAPALSARPTRELRGYLAGISVAPKVEDLTFAAQASRGIAGITAADLLNSTGVIDLEAADLLEEEVVEPWLTGPQNARQALLDRLGALDPEIPALLAAAWAQVETDGPAAVAMASHAAVEVLDRTLRVLAPDEAVLKEHAAGRLKHKDAVFDKGGKPMPTRGGRVAFAVMKCHPGQTKLITSQTRALAVTVTTLQENLQAGKHNSNGTVALVRSYLVSVEATLTQLLHRTED